MRIRLWAAVMAALSIVVTACGGGSEGGPAGPVVNPPNPVIVSVVLDCGADTTMISGSDRLCTAEVQMSDGTKRVVTGDASWSATGPVSVVPGKVTAMAPGSAEVVVTYNGKTASIKFVVKKKDTFTWAELPFLPEDGRQVVATYNTGSFGGRVTRITDTVIKVWAQPGIDPEDLRLAGQFWSGYLKSLRFELVADSASAHTVVVWDSQIDTLRSMNGGPSIIDGGVIKKGVIKVATHHKGVVAMGWETRVKNYAHEFGHVFGIAGHPSGLHIMSYERGLTMALDQLMLSVYVWLCESGVEPGIKIAP